MGKIGSTLAIAFIYVFAVSLSYAADDELNEKRAQDSQRFTVKVLVEEGDVLTSAVTPRHGSGFIYSLTDTEGIVFTNRHVVQMLKRNAARFQLEFFRGREKTAVDASLVFISPIFDFAVLKFDPSKMKRFRDFIKVAEVASREEFDTLARKGASVMACGNPFESVDNATFGKITGEFSHSLEGVLLQIDAAINSGNSGGPLVHINKGKIIGINTARNFNADGMGFSLPIQNAVEEYELFRQRSSYQKMRRLMALTNFVRMYHLTQGLHIERVAPESILEPGFYGNYDGLLQIVKAHPSTHLMEGDILLSVDGKIVGDRTYKIRQSIQRSAGLKAKVKVIRNYREVVEVEADLAEMNYAQEGSDLELVSFAGVVFEEVNELVGWAKTDDQTRVLITKLMPNSWGGIALEEYGGSFLKSINVGGTEFRIHRLQDLKTALTAVPADVKAVVLTMYTPAFFEAPNGKMLVVRDPIFDELPTLNMVSKQFVVPIDAVYDDDGDFLAARSNFDFSGFAVGQRRPGLSGMSSRLVGCAASIAYQPIRTSP